MNINKLVDKYSKGRDAYLKTVYNETLLRSDFLDVFFELLGWDIKNKQGKSTFEREVILEEGLKTGNKETKKPDYTFRLFNQRKFFLEAKKPSVNIETDIDTAKQVRRYGFTAKLNVSVLSNFEYLLIYDCSGLVKSGDTSTTCLVKKYHYTEYADKFEEIKSLIGRETVYSGKFDEQWKSIESKIDTYNIDKLFLNQINDWRVSLGKAILDIKKGLSEAELNDCVQAYINSIIFLRVCEDRNIETYRNLLNIETEQNCSKLVEMFKEADKRYNSGLFLLPYSKEIISTKNGCFWDIITSLYYPNSIYSFAVFASDILGNIYELFLQDKLYIRNNIVVLDRKPENIDRDVVTTPTFIIQNILSLTLLDKLKGKKPVDILNLKIVDISCGSGAFIIEAFQYINDYLIDYYLTNNKDKLVQLGTDKYKLHFNEKKTILTNCIYAVDKDYNAVKTTQFGLLLKLLEDETSETLPSTSSILPELNHIYYGNSLIDSVDVNNLSREDKNKINPFDFNIGFDVIVGNPPYMKTEDIKNFLSLEKPIYENKYESATKQYDKYFLFVERSLNLLNENGVAGYILPNKFTKVEAGKKLRSLLIQGQNVRSLISFGANQIFTDKTTYTNIIIFSKAKNAKLGYLEVNNLGAWRLGLNNTFNEIDYKKMSDEAWAFYPSHLAAIFDKLFIDTKILKDFVGEDNIFNGIQTSRNDYYVFKPTREDNEFFYFDKNDTNWQIEKEIVRPYYETFRGADDSLNTYRVFKPNSYVIYPYKKEGDTVKFIEIDELRHNYPCAYRYFTDNKDNFVNSYRGGKRDIQPVPANENEWYRYGRSQALSLGEITQKIVVGVMSQGDKYAIDNYRTLLTSGGTAGYCMITLPNNSKYSIYYLQALLNSKPVEWLASLYGEVFRGGYIARGTKVLGQLPIKTINFDDEEEKVKHDLIVLNQKKLIDIQTEIDDSKENKRKTLLLQREFDKSKQDLDNLILSLYSLSLEEYNSIPNIREIYETDSK